MSTVSEIETALKPLLADPRPHLVQIGKLLTSPLPKRWSRPWLVNRYTRNELPGVEAIWDSVIEAIAPLFRDASADTRHAAAALTLLAPSSTAVPLLETALDDELTRVRALAIQSLAAQGAAPLAQRIPALVRSDVPEVRVAAVAAIGQLGMHALGETLGTLIDDDPSPDVRSWALRVVGELYGSQAIELLVNLLSDANLPAPEASGAQLGLVAVGDPATDALLELLDSSTHGRVRNRVVKTLTEFTDPRVEPALLKALELGCPQTELGAALALAHRKVPAGLERLRLRSGAVEEHIRFAALAGRVELGDYEALGPYLLGFWNSRFRANVEASLRQLRSPGRHALAGLLQTSGAPLQRIIAEVSGPLYLEQATDALLAIGRSHDDTILRLHALNSLALLEQTEAARLLLDMLRDEPDQTTRTSWRNLLIDSWGPMPPLIKAAFTASANESDPR